MIIHALCGCLTYLRVAHGQGFRGEREYRKPLTDLPDSLRELAELIGLPSAMILTDRWGGVRLNIPVRMGPDHPLALYLSLKAARKLAGYYGGDRIAVPCGRAVMRAVRD